MNSTSFVSTCSATPGAAPWRSRWRSMPTVASGGSCLRQPFPERGEYRLLSEWPRRCSALVASPRLSGAAKPRRCSTEGTTVGARRDRIRPASLEPAPADGRRLRPPVVRDHRLDEPPVVAPHPRVDTPSGGGRRPACAAGQRPAHGSLAASGRDPCSPQRGPPMATGPRRGQLPGHRDFLAR
jgi:hypothetical protein